MAIQKNPNTFANNPLDRASDKRMDPAWLAAQLGDSATLIAPFWRLKPFVIPSKDPARPGEIGWLRSGIMGTLAPKEATTVFLGLNGDIAHFAMDISAAADPEHDGPLAGLGHFVDLREIAPDLAPGDAAILAQGKSMIDWHARHQFCAACGHATKLEEGGYKRQCANVPIVMLNISRAPTLW